MTTKTLTTVDGDTITVNVELIEYTRVTEDGNYFCRMTTGDSLTFTTNPFE